MKKQNQNGYSLAELVLVIAVLGLIVSTSAVAFKPVMDTWSLDSPRNDMIDSSSYALSRMSYEIAGIKDAASVSIANSGQIQFTDASDRVVSFQLAGTNLMRNADLLASFLQSLVFNYYDINNALIVSPQVSPANTNIWRIEIEVTSQKNNQSVGLRSEVHPRNIPRS